MFAAVFPTAIGACGIVWTERGVAALRLPAASPAAMRNHLRSRFPGVQEADPPPDMAAVIDRIVALLRGEPVDLCGVVLDFEGIAAFERRVYEMARTIPPGSTMTYGEIADRIQEPGRAREVGQALGRNPFAIIVPCHRVVAAGRKSGGFSAPGGVATKLRLLAIEGASSDTVDGTLFDRIGGLPRVRARGRA